MAIRFRYRPGDLHDLFTELDLRDAVLIGWSNGSFNVWQYLHDYGDERIAAVALVDTSHAR